MTYQHDNKGHLEAERLSDVTGNKCSAAELLAVANSDNDSPYIHNDRYVLHSYSAHDKYELEFDRVGTLEDLCTWVYHLTGKEWFTRKHTHEFIKQWCKVNGINPDGFSQSKHK